MKSQQWRCFAILSLLGLLSLSCSLGGLIGSDEVVISQPTIVTELVKRTAMSILNLSQAHWKPMNL